MPEKISYIQHNNVKRQILGSLAVHLPHSELGFAPPVRHIFETQARHKEESLNVELWQLMKDIPGVERDLCPHLSAGSTSE